MVPFVCLHTAFYTQESWSALLLYEKNPDPDSYVDIARAYFVSSADNPDHLNRAEATLNELISSLDASFDRVRDKSFIIPEYGTHIA